MYKVGSQHLNLAIRIEFCGLHFAQCYSLLNLRIMYTDKLIKEVKECFPDYLKMHELAETGNVWLGRYLDDNSDGSVSLDTILTASNLQEIQDKARAIKRKRNCYNMWCNEDPRRKRF